MEHNLAVLIDFENIAAGVEKEGLGRLKIDRIMDRFKEKGRILVARSYADWGRFAKYKQRLMMEGISLFELTSHGMQDKNRADVALVVDCMELAFTKDYIDTFVIISGDSDFTPLVLKLKELNKRVIGCGTRRSTSRLIVEACDEFIFYDSLRGARPEERTGPPEPEARPDSNNTITKSTAFTLTIETLEGLQREESQKVHASILKQAMLRKEPTFSGPDLGYASFTRFLEACRDRGLVVLSRDDRSGGYFVDLPDGSEESEEGAPPPSALRDAFTGGALTLYAALAEGGISPLPRDLRELVAAGLVATYQSRRERRLKCTLRYFHQDVFKQIQSLNASLTSRHVKHVIEALHRGGFFLHGGGGPVRTKTAKFELKSDKIADILGILDRVYLSAISALGMNPGVNDIAEIIFGDAEAVDALEALILKMREEPEVSPYEADLDGEEAEAPEDVEEDAEEDAEEADVEPSDVSDAEDVIADDDAADEEPRRRRRRHRRPRREKSEAEADAVTSEALETSAEDAPAEAPAAEHVADEPVADGPAEEPAAEESAAEEPAAEEPAAEEPAAEAPAEEPAAESAEESAETPATDAPAEEPAAAEPAADEPTEEPAAEEPAADGPAADEPAADGPAADESAADEPAADEPAADEGV